jgi:hypothetical protein
MHCNKETDMQQHKRCNSVQPTAPALYSGSNIHTPLTNHDEEGAFCGNSSQGLSKPIRGFLLKENMNENDIDHENIKGN